MTSITRIHVWSRVKSTSTTHLLTNVHKTLITDKHKRTCSLRNKIFTKFRVQMSRIVLFEIDVKLVMIKFIIW